MLQNYPPNNRERVVRVEFVRERVYPWHDQVLHDYRVIFEDGTVDCMSYSPGGQPKVGTHQLRAIEGLGGDFVWWGETLERLSR